MTRRFFKLYFPLICILLLSRPGGISVHFSNDPLQSAAQTRIDLSNNCNSFTKAVWVAAGKQSHHIDEPVFVTEENDDDNEDDDDWMSFKKHLKGHSLLQAILFADASDPSDPTNSFFLSDNFSLVVPGRYLVFQVFRI